METCASFFDSVHETFPILAAEADRLRLAQWGCAPDNESSYFVWFESVARAINSDMRQGVRLAECTAFFESVRRVFHLAEDKVKECIDVAFVENLFWQVPPLAAGPYWKALPPVLKELHLTFHSPPRLKQGCTTAPACNTSFAIKEI